MQSVDDLPRTADQDVGLAARAEILAGQSRNMLGSRLISETIKRSLDEIPQKRLASASSTVDPLIRFGRARQRGLARPHAAAKVAIRINLNANPIAAKRASLLR